jgi:hypothetical protein
LKFLGVKTLGDIGVILKKKKILDIEFLLVIAFAGVIPGMVFDIPGASAFFFSDFQRWLSLSFILALAPLWWPKIVYKKSLGVSGLKVSVVCFILVIAFVSYYSYRNIESIFLYGFVRKNIKIRYQIMSEESGPNKMGHAGYIKYLISQKHTPIREAIVTVASQAQKDLEKNKKYQLVMFLKNQSHLPNKQDTTIYVPQSSYFYWNIANYRNVQFLAPSLTGMAMIGGVQPFAPVELSEEEKETITEDFDAKRMQAFTSFYSKVASEKADSVTKKPTFKYILKKDLIDDEKMTVYNLISPEYYHLLQYYGYWSYSFPSEKEYLEMFSTDEKICKQVTEKGFSKVLVITTDKDLNPQSRELNCR